MAGDALPNDQQTGASRLIAPVLRRLSAAIVVTAALGCSAPDATIASSSSSSSVTATTQAGAGKAEASRPIDVVDGWFTAGETRIVRTERKNSSLCLEFGSVLAFEDNDMCTSSPLREDEAAALMYDGPTILVEGRPVPGTIGARLLAVLVDDSIASGVLSVEHDGELVRIAGPGDANSVVAFLFPSDSTPKQIHLLDGRGSILLTCAIQPLDENLALKTSDCSA